MSKVTKAIIPAAGLGTRFLPATKSVPKEMLTIVDAPIIFYVVEEALNAGASRHQVRADGLDCRNGIVIFKGLQQQIMLVMPLVITSVKSLVLIERSQDGAHGGPHVLDHRQQGRQPAVAVDSKVKFSVVAKLLLGVVTGLGLCKPLIDAR